MKTQKSDGKTPKALVIPDRAAIPDRYKWNPSVIFPDVKAWDREKRALQRIVPQLKQHLGQCSRTATRLARCLDQIYAVRLRLEHLDAYASRLYDIDVRQSRSQARSAAADKLYTDFLEATAFLEPELLALPEETLRSYLEDPRLADYDRYLTQLCRLRRHVLSQPEEAILAGTSTLGSAPHSIFKTFANADLEFPSFVDRTGRSVTLSAATYSQYRQSADRDERRQVFELFWGTHRKYRNSFSQMIAAQIDYYDFVARTRSYPSALHASLQSDAIPPAFYEQLVGAVSANLHVFHRYLAVRRRLLGIEGDQYYYDIYPPLAEHGRRRYTYEQSRRLISRALKPLGRGYTRMLRQALADGSGWVDVFPNRGKRSGAYSSSVYGRHPLVLCNFMEDFDSLSTLAHELGHALHSALSNERQPYPKADYSLFNAEVASIFNETLLIEYLLNREQDPAERLYLLSAYLDSFRGTVFRQTLFAEFELAVYRRTAARKGLTADSLSRLYLRLLRKYHGHAEGVMHIEPLYGIEWAYIPHFYYNFYVYQYVSGFIAATALADRVLRLGAPAARQYINKLLRAGSSRDPLDILKDAGVDMMSAGPYRRAIKRFSGRITELERLARRSMK